MPEVNMDIDLMVFSWVENAKWAASGGNSQPWGLKWSFIDNRIVMRLFIEHEYKAKRASPMDVNGMASIMALGCYALNLRVMANLNGFVQEKIEFIEQKSLWSGEVVITYREGFVEDNAYLPGHLYQRRTNRNSYKKTPLAAATTADLKQIHKKYCSHLSFSEATSHKRSIKKNLIYLERVRWRTSGHLESLLSEITFDEKSAFGIPSKQLGILLVDQILLKKIKQYQWLQTFVRRVGYLISSYQNFVKPVENSGGLFFIQAKDSSLESLFWMGHCYQEMWTELNKQGYAFQPISVSLVAMGLLAKNEKLSTYEQMALEKGRYCFSEKLNLDIELPSLGFRTGVCQKAVGKSGRRPSAEYVSYIEDDNWENSLASVLDKTQYKK